MMIKKNKVDMRLWSLYIDDQKIRTYKSKRAAAIAYNRAIKDSDTWQEIAMKLEWQRAQ